jgi:hypothetical protein
MRRILIALVMSGAVLVAAPGAALAQHHHARHHHARHHARHHRSRRHSRVRHFGRRAQDPSGNPSGQAGTVASFDNGVLTITLNDGSTVSGAVTNDTELECTAPGTTTQGEDGDRGDDNSTSGDDNNPSGDGDNRGENSGDRGDDNGTDNTANGDDDTANGDDNAANGEDNGENDNENQQMCSTSSLTPGTPVAEANLEISGSGNTWKKVELITS